MLTFNGNFSKLEPFGGQRTAVLKSSTCAFKTHLWIGVDKSVCSFALWCDVMKVLFLIYLASVCLHRGHFSTTCINECAHTKSFDTFH